MYNKKYALALIKEAVHAFASAYTEGEKRK